MPLSPHIKFRNEALLSAAQGLFMLLPITGLVHMSGGKGVLLTPPKCVIVVSAITAFSILVIMFYLENSDLGVGLCVGNLVLRIMEALRVGQLHLRAAAAQGKGEKLLP
jgi:hypothetical protein